MILSSVCSVPAETGLGVISTKQRPLKRDREELRALWKKAINQQLLLIRMERENARLRGISLEHLVQNYMISSLK
jgi:hypothetical protein